jgi:hypothetical protein
MKRRFALLAFLSVVTLWLSAHAVEPRAVMGNWEGRWYGDDGSEGPLAAQVIAEGKGNFQAVISVAVEGTGPFPGEMRGEDRGSTVEFKGKVDIGYEFGGVYQLSGSISEGRFAGRFSGSQNQGRFELKKVEKSSPTLGAKPPEGAVILFDGKELSKWVKGENDPNPWLSVGDAMEVRNGSIHTVEEFGSFKLHLEFRTPFEPEDRGQGRGNSGVYLPDNNEIQVLDSFGLTPRNNECGAFYGTAAPKVNACLPPEEWQTYDVTFIAPRFDENDECIKKTVVTVLQNGVKIHDQVELSPKRRASKAPILLQDHGDKVQYRNIWLVPLKAE